MVPQSLREEVMQELHAGVIGGHVRESKTLQQLKCRFYWPGRSLDVKDWCQTCSVCASRKINTPKNYAPLQTIKAGSPMQVITVNTMGPLPESSNNNSYILVVADYFTRWMLMLSITRKQLLLLKNLLMMFFADWEYPNSCILTKGSNLKVNSSKNCARYSRLPKLGQLLIIHSVMGSSNALTERCKI